MYTNHCTCGSTATAMKIAGYSLQDIAHVLGHRNLESLKYYFDQPTLKDKENFADDLFKYTGNPDETKTTNDSDLPHPLL